MQINYLASLSKWLSFRLPDKCILLIVLLQSLKLKILHLFEARNSFTLKQLYIKVTAEFGFSLKCARDMVRTYNQIHGTDNYSQYKSIFSPVSLNGWVFIYDLDGYGFSYLCSHLNWRYRTCFEQGVPYVKATIEIRFTLKRVRGMIRTYSQMHGTVKYSQHKSIIWPDWLNGLVFA